VSDVIDPAAVSLLYVVCTTSVSFVGFSALVMSVRQGLSGGISTLEAWITRTFVQLGFLVSAGALTPPVLAVCQARADITWRLCSGAMGVVLLIFAGTYPSRRSAVSGVPTPKFVRMDLGLLVAVTAVLLFNSLGWPVRPSAGLYAAGLVGVLFVSGLGYLHALGAGTRENL
jgi:hypothetical protein